MPSSGAHFPLLPVWGSRPETEIIGFAGRRARTLPPSGSPTPILSGRGSRPETEIIGFARRRARTLLSSGAHFPLLPVWGSRPETEIIGFAGRRARTLPPSGSQPPFFRAGVCVRKPNSLALRIAVRKPGAGKNEKVRLCIRNRIILSCYRAMHLICLEF